MVFSPGLNQQADYNDLAAGVANLIDMTPSYIHGWSFLRSVATNLRLSTLFVRVTKIDVMIVLLVH